LFPTNEVVVAQYELAEGTNVFDTSTLLEKIYPGGRFLLIRCFPSLVVRNPNCRSLEFDEKRENAVSANERLQLEAPAVLVHYAW